MHTASFGRENALYVRADLETDYSGFANQPLTAGNTIENSNTLSSSCDLTLDVGESENWRVQVYPSPAKDFITISSKDIGIKNITLFNLLGEIAYYNDNIPFTDKLSIPIGQYPRGIYFLSISDGRFSIKTLLKVVILP